MLLAIESLYHVDDIRNFLLWSPTDVGCPSLADDPMYRNGPAALPRHFRPKHLCLASSHVVGWSKNGLTRDLSRNAAPGPHEVFAKSDWIVAIMV